MWCIGLSLGVYIYKNYKHVIRGQCVQWDNCGMYHASNHINKHYMLELEQLDINPDLTEHSKKGLHKYNPPN